MLELRREGDNSYLIIIRKPSNEAFLTINTHSDNRLIFKPKLSSQIDCISSRIDIAPESKSNKMLTVDIGTILDKGITDPNEHIIANCINFDLEVGFAFLGKTMLTVDYHKHATFLYYVISLKLVLIDVFRGWIWLELKDFPILLTFVHELLDPFTVGKNIFLIEPVYLQFVFKLLLDISFKLL